MEKKGFIRHCNCRGFHPSLFALVIFTITLISKISTNGVNGSSRSLAEKEHVRLRILEFDRESEKLRQVVTATNSDIIYGENIAQEGNAVILLECRSSYGPVIFSYKGDGVPDFATTTNTTKTVQGIQYYWTFMSWRHDLPLQAMDTGNYSCISVHNPSLRNSMYLYVPDASKAVFVPTASELNQRVVYTKENYFRIPCSVVHPSARVVLEKVTTQTGVVNSNRVRYNPKSGFFLPIAELQESSQRSPVSTEVSFVCKSYFRGKHDESEFRIVAGIGGDSISPESHDIGPVIDAKVELLPSLQNQSRNNIFPSRQTPLPTSQGSPTLRSACSPTTCGIFAECIVIDYAAHCVCFENYTGDPWTRCEMMAENEQFQQLQNENPCNPNPCQRRNATCLVVNQHPVCTCQGNHYGTPTLCRPGPGSRVQPLRVTTARPFKEAASVSICKPTSCGFNAKCKVGPHLRPICACPEGYSGDARTACHKDLHLPTPLQNHPCLGVKCGVGAYCDDGICNCPQGTSGNAEIGCITLRPQHPSDTPNPTPSQVHVDTVGKACSICGQNSVCTFTQKKVRCECALNFTGTPPNCNRGVSIDRDFVHPRVAGKCRSDFDCSRQGQVCEDGRCAFRRASVLNTTPTPSSSSSCTINCGPNTICRTVTPDELEGYKKTKHDPIYKEMIRVNRINWGGGIFSECLCRNGFEGNPYAISGCAKSLVKARRPSIPLPRNDPQEDLIVGEDPCSVRNNPCGNNSFCRAYKEKAYCSCDFSSTGRPPNCRRRCELDSHCKVGEFCTQGFCTN